MIVTVIVSGALCSTLGTLAIKKSNNFREMAPSIAAIICYAGSTWFLAQAMNAIPIAIAHATWSGLVAMILLAIDRLYFKVTITKKQATGLFFVVCGISIMGVYH